jgi:hypothetical protein
MWYSLPLVLLALAMFRAGTVEASASSTRESTLREIPLNARQPSGQFDLT